MTVDDYIRSFPEDVGVKLEEIRGIINSLAPEAIETISYQMPTYLLNGILFHFAGFKGHIGLYPTPSGIAAFEKELAPYKHGKGSVQFPLDKPLPRTLIEKILLFRIEENRLVAPKSGRKHSKKIHEKIAES